MCIFNDIAFVFHISRQSWFGAIQFANLLDGKRVMTWIGLGKIFFRMLGVFTFSKQSLLLGYFNKAFKYFASAHVSPKVNYNDMSGYYPARLATSSIK